MNKEVIKAITEIANSDRVKEKIEPKLFTHLEITDNFTERVLYSFLLFQSELDKRDNEEIDQ